MKTIVKSLKLILSVLILNISFSNAQKLPNVQKRSIYAPQNIKMDGTATEWNDTFEAYNKAVDLFYTVSNDDKNIYLIVKTKYKDVIDKILRGGLTFTINPGPNKKDKNSVSVTYPVLEGPDMWIVANKLAHLNNLYKEGETINVNELNQLFYTKEKTLTVTGIEQISDQSISIYNDNGIKPASLFDDKMTYTYELALPIAYIKLPNKDGVTFKYQIKINEAPAMQRPAVITASTPPPPPPMPVGTLATTDFWGEYTLAKKP